MCELAEKYRSTVIRKSSLEVAFLVDFQRLRLIEKQASYRPTFCPLGRESCEQRVLKAKGSIPNPLYPSPSRQLMPCTDDPVLIRLRVDRGHVWSAPLKAHNA